MTTTEVHTDGMLPPYRLELAEHRRRYGPGRWTGTPAQLTAAVAGAGIRGRGGGGFPLAAKLSAIDSRRRPSVVANGCEGDPLSRKDEALLSLAPHLVLDGLTLAATAIGAGEAYLCIHTGAPALGSVRRAVTEHGFPVRIVELPARFVASEESALIQALRGGESRPTVKPPRPSERGVHGRPSLVANVETLAQLAMLVRLGPDGYARTRTELVTVSGDVHSPGVYEVPAGCTVGQIVQRAGLPAAPRAVLSGGHGGSWLRWPEACDSLPECGLAAYRVLGAGCGLQATARMLEYLAGQSARQCGPCMFGLPAIAADLCELAGGRNLQTARNPQAARDRLWRRLPVIAGRGACAHPDGAVRLAGSALRVFADDVRAHLSGWCLS